MKETLISVAKLLEANFKNFFRLPHHCLTDGFEPTKCPSYGGFLLLPPVAPSHDRKMIILHYADSTWRLPTSPSSGSSSDPLRASASLRPLTTVPDTNLQGMDLPDNWDREDFSPFSEKEVKALKIQAARKMTLKGWHDSLGHLHSGNLSRMRKVISEMTFGFGQKLQRLSRMMAEQSHGKNDWGLAYFQKIY
jgi:hypothetical protein